jgi:(methylthio)acryloyl-CoA hydratase
MTRTPLQTLKLEIDGPVATLTMNRPDKRNAMNDQLLRELDGFFSEPPEGVKVVMLTGTEGHFCSGLDLSEHVARDAEGTLRHSRGWHAVMDKIQFSGLPVVSAMFGAVIGGGLELATATHVRIAEPSVIFQLPEGRRGIYVGGGASVQGGAHSGGGPHGRDDADRTQIQCRGRAASWACATMPLAPVRRWRWRVIWRARSPCNAGLSNYMMIHALARIEDMSKADGLFTESLCAGLTQTSPDAQEGLKAFLQKRSPDFR